ncbi:MAG: hypothetical protein NTW31_12525 [Bacteroidetes bacterium]|nr:hypothetical protein [Bacteroidota bacterium]
MEKITSVSRLKDAIQLLEDRQAFQGQMLKEQVYGTIEALKPGNILKNTLANLASTPNLVDSVLSTAIGLGTGYLSKKIIVGPSGNIFRKFIGKAFQLGVTAFIAQHPIAVKSVGRYILQHSVRKNIGILKSRDR